MNQAQLVEKYKKSTFKFRRFYKEMFYYINDEAEVEIQQQYRGEFEPVMTLEQLMAEGDNEFLEVREIKLK